MIEFNGRKFCENCFSEWTVGTFCTHCGYNPDVTATDPTMLKPGSILLGKYIVGKVIGKGGFGVTYVAYDITANKKVAIKEFFPYGVALRAPGTTTVSVSSMNNAEAFRMGAEKFFNEAQLVSKFNGNPNIVGVHEFFYENDTVYFAMEYLQGHTLKEHIQEHGVLTPAQALFIFQNVSNALMAAHSLNVMHRDISPDNIILCDNGDVKLIDFGAARQVVAEHSQSFSVILKPGFAPLEQYQKKGNQGPWTDIYSLGATIYHSLTEDIPEDPMSRIDDDEDFSSNKYNIEPELWAIIKKATELKIEDRYGDVFMLKNDLNNVSYQPEPVIIPTEAPSEKMPDFHTAVPFGMTQTAAQPAQQPAQPVTVAAGDPAPSAQPAQPAAGTAVDPISLLQPKETAQQEEPASQPQKEKFSFKKHIGAILSIAAALVIVIGAAIIIPKLINKPDVPTVSDNPPLSGSAPLSSQPTESSQPTRSSADPTSSTSSTPEPHTIDPRIDLSDRVIYKNLNERQKTIYELLCEGYSNNADEIDLSSYDYTKAELNQVVPYIARDIPEFYYVTWSYPDKYYDINKNGEVDDDEVLVSTRPYYINADETKMKNAVLNFSQQNSGKTTMEKLYEFHDMLIRNVEIVESGATGNSYGAIVEHKAQSWGLAYAFSYYANYLGLESVTVAGHINGEVRDWCRVKIDGVWYNVDVYGDKIAGSCVKKLNISPENTDCYHTYFLCNDEYFMDGCGYSLYSQYKFMVDGEYAANSKYTNYYIQGGMKGKSYNFHYNVDSAYNRMVDWAAERYNDGHLDSSSRVASFIHDDLSTKLLGNLIEDLKIKHGITVSGFSWTYNLDNSSYKITLSP